MSKQKNKQNKTNLNCGLNKITTWIIVNCNIFNWFPIMTLLFCNQGRKILGDVSSYPDCDSHPEIHIMFSLGY